MINKTRGNMYGFVYGTWNPIQGECEHDCLYCFMKQFPLGKLKLNPKTLNDDLGGEFKFLFVGSSTDMFASNVPKKWIEAVLEKCNEYPDNRYLFQTKNPERFREFIHLFPEGSILCITLESNLDYNVSKAPKMKDRVEAFKNIHGFEKMITIEPIIDFEEQEFLEMIKEIDPDFINVGADSKNSKLIEPKKDKIEWLIKQIELMSDTKLIPKDNLKRLLK